MKAVARWLRRVALSAARLAGAHTHGQAEIAMAILILAMAIITALVLLPAAREAAQVLLAGFGGG
ncbi:MAG: hypothetical protein ACP5OO_11215 [Chloroflexia bacterium]